MADDAEMIAQFAENFRKLEIKLASTEAERSEEQRKVHRLEQQLAAAHAELERKDGELKHKSRELEDAHSLKDRLFAQNVTIEHLKGRIESLKKAAADRESEHAVQIGQLQTHMHDLSSRLEFAKDSMTLAAVKQQHAETEERCALLASQAIDEKERAAQERSMVAVVVRDVQGRNMELETRCRGLETDLVTLRQAARKSLELQREDAAEKERALVDLAAALNQSAELKKRVSEAEAGFIAREGDLRAQLAARQREFEAERDNIVAQVTAANGRVAELDGLRANDAERLRVLQRQVASAADSVRAEITSELDGVRRSLLASKDEADRSRYRCQQLEQQLDATRRQLRDSDSRLASEQERGNALQIRAETAAGTEAWLGAERDRLADLVHRGEARIDELSKALHAAEAGRLEAQKLKVQLQFSQEETREALEDAQRSSNHLRRAQEAFEARVVAVRREAKEQQKAMNSVLKRQEKEKKRLLLAILEREQEEAATATMTTLRHSAVVPATSDGIATGGGRYHHHHHHQQHHVSSAKINPLTQIRAQQARVQRYQNTMDSLLNGGSPDQS